MLERLHEGSLEAGATEDDLPCGRAASEAEATALVAWLSDDARLPVPRAA